MTLLAVAVAARAVVALSRSARARTASGRTITWNREISRIVYDRCASCHRPGGTAFSLMTYADAQPQGERDQGRRAVATDAAVGRGQGFRALPERSEPDAGADRADHEMGRRRHPARQQPASAAEAAVFARAARQPPVPPAAIRVRGRSRCSTTSSSTACCRNGCPPAARCGSSRVLPGGSVEPLVWLHGYDSRFRASLPVPTAAAPSRRDRDPGRAVRTPSSR